MASWMNLGQLLKVNAVKFPNTVALMDANRRFTYPQTNKRVNQLAHSLLSLGLQKGDKVAVFMENSIEIIEIFLATAKTGIVIVPINFRLLGKEDFGQVFITDARHDRVVEICEQLDGHSRLFEVADGSIVGFTDHSNLKPKNEEE